MVSAKLSVKMMLLWIVLVLGLVSAKTTNDTPCKLDIGEQGSCVPQKYCKGESGNICGYFENSVAVCCPTKYVSYTTGSNEKQKPSSIVREKRQDEDQTQDRISKRRCLDFLYTNNTVYISVFNGRDALPKEFRHMALLGYGNENAPDWLCGGTLISQNHILTAAHCITQGAPVVVRLGELDISRTTDDAKPEDYKVKSTVTYPEYRPPLKYHDIAIIELTEPVSKTDYIEVACLDDSFTHSETAYIVTGWGKTEFSGDASTKLLAADLTPFDYQTCRNAYGSNDQIPFGIAENGMICAGGQSDSCFGDSGGPLVIIDEGLSKTFRHAVYTLVGVTSFGKACGITQDPGIYTRVSYYLRWIEQTIWPESNG